MASTCVIERKICLEPQYFDKDIRKHIFNKVKQTMKNECSKEYGYILNVNKLLKIEENSISSNCEHVFRIKIEVENLKPEVGKELLGEVCMIFSGGIFINIKNLLKVLIPISYIQEYKFNQEMNIFYNINDKNNTIKQGDSLNVIISGIKYSKQNFSCFGKLK